jgi:hypothetical protein
MAQGGTYRRIYEMQARIEGELQKEIDQAHTGRTGETSEVAKELADVAL